MVIQTTNAAASDAALAAYEEAGRTQLERIRPERTDNEPSPSHQSKNALKHQINRGHLYAEDRITLSPEALREIRELKMRDQEVRSHELAHSSVGGQYAGSPTYAYTRGPDGRLYAVGGEVDIDTSTVPGDPEATLEKAEKIVSSALAPANPSAADRNIAARANQMAAEARSQMMREAQEEVVGDEINGKQQESRFTGVSGIYPFSSPPPADLTGPASINLLV